MMLMAFARSMTSTCRGPWPDEVATRSDPSFLTTRSHHPHLWGCCSRCKYTPTLPRQISTQNTPLSFAYLYFSCDSSSACRAHDCNHRTCRRGAGHVFMTEQLSTSLPSISTSSWLLGLLVLVLGLLPLTSLAKRLLFGSSTSGGKRSA